MSAPRPGAAVRVVRIVVEPLDQALEVHLAVFKLVAVCDLALKEPIQVLTGHVDPRESVACVGTRRRLRFAISPEAPSPVFTALAYLAAHKEFLNTPSNRAVYGVPDAVPVRRLFAIEVVVLDVQRRHHPARRLLNAPIGVTDEVIETREGAPAGAGLDDDLCCVVVGVVGVQGVEGQFTGSAGVRGRGVDGRDPDRGDPDEHCRTVQGVGLPVRGDIKFDVACSDPAGRIRPHPGAHVVPVAGVQVPGLVSAAVDLHVVRGGNVEPDVA